MSFLKDIGGGAGGNPLAGGLGHLFGTDASHVSSIADRIGQGMNMVAAGGGAQPGYARPAGYQPQQAAPQDGDTNNHLQLLDPDVLQSIIARFRPASTGVQY